MATVNLGSIKFNWKGTYAGATAYKIDDVVEYNGSSYISIQAGTGNLPTDTAYWELMSQKGTNGTDGTDLTTTLTTQGDLVYRDGSGLQRLGAGTAGQVLQTGGTGANPSWGTVSSDYVKIASTEVTSAVTSVEFTEVFDSTYDRYIIVGDNLNASTSATNMLFRAFTGVNTELATNGDYTQLGDGARIESSGANSVITYGNWAGYDRVFLSYNQGNGTGTGVRRGSNLRLEITNPSDTTNGKWIIGQIIYWDNGNGIHATNMGISVNTTSAVTGFKIYDSTFTSGKVSVYGLK